MRVTREVALKARLGGGVGISLWFPNGISNNESLNRMSIQSLPAVTHEARIRMGEWVKGEIDSLIMAKHSGCA